MSKNFSLWLGNNRSWIYTIQYIVLSMVLLLLVGLIDLRIWPIQLYIPDFLLMSVGLAQSLLTTLTGALLTITTFTFSTILTVLTTYATNFSPRVVRNFLNQRITLHVLGIFVGGFFYCIIALFLMRETFFQTEQVIAGGIGILYTVVCMIYFVVFVHQVIHSLRGVNVVQNVYNETLPVIEEEVSKRKNSVSYQRKDYSKSVKIYAKNSGYLSVIDYEAIMHEIDEFDTALVIEQRLGDYIVQGFHLATLQYNEPLDISDEEQRQVLGNIAKSFYYQEEKHEEEDYRYNISKLVEIAIRAAGPGINDPNTAMHCIRKISIILGKLFSTGKYYTTVRDEDDTVIIYKGYPLSQELYFSYYQIIYYCKEDPSVMGALLEGLLTTYMMADDLVRSSIRDYFGYVYELVVDNASAEQDIRYFESLYRQFNGVEGDVVNKEIMEEAGHL